MNPKPLNPKQPVYTAPGVEQPSDSLGEELLREGLLHGFCLEMGLGFSEQGFRA